MFFHLILLVVVVFPFLSVASDGRKRLRKSADNTTFFLMISNNSEARIVEGFLAGDRAANERVAAHIEAAYRSWQGKFGYEADDIVSDVRYKLLLLLRRGDFHFRSSLRTYVKQIVDHTCIDYLRFRQRVNSVDINGLQLADSSLSPEEKLQSRQEARITFRVLRLVPRECLQLWRMQLRSGLTCCEIGGILEKSEGNIRRKLWTCRESAKKIREKIQKRDKPL